MNINILKKAYSAPKVEKIELDNQISLQLESYAPEFPGENGIVKNEIPEYFNNDIMQSNLS